MTVVALTSVTLDCPDPDALASFYRQIAGGEITYRSPEFVYLACVPVGLGFQKTQNPTPHWPDPAQPLRTHLDFDAGSPDRLDDLEATVIALGARRPTAQPRPASWRTLLDPAGHPFCLTTLTS